MIRVDVRAKSFGSTPILRDVRFEVAPGETLAILGPSGIGKSTLLGIIAGTDTAFDGTVDAPARRAIVFQEPVLLPWRSALENITLIHPALERSAAVAALGRVGLSDKADLFPGQLSLGQQRRLSLARAFANNPEMLIMDEPFVSLDAAMAEEMIALAETLIRDTRPATIFVTHALSEAERLADRVLHLSGKPASIVP